MSYVQVHNAFGLMDGSKPLVCLCCNETGSFYVKFRLPHRYKSGDVSVDDTCVAEFKEYLQEVLSFGLPHELFATESSAALIISRHLEKYSDIQQSLGSLSFTLHCGQCGYTVLTKQTAESECANRSACSNLTCFICQKPAKYESVLDHCAKCYIDNRCTFNCDVCRFMRGRDLYQISNNDIIERAKQWACL